MFPFLENSGASQEQDDDRIVDRDETDPYNEVIFGRRRPDSVAIEWTSKTAYILEFKRTSDQRPDYRERGECRARGRHDVLVKSLETVAKEAEGESAGWTVKLIIFVRGTCGSVHAQTFNSNLKELGVVKSKRNTIRRGFVHELLNAQDTVISCADILRKEWVRKTMVVVRRVRGKKSFKDWKDSNDNWGQAVQRNMDREVEVDRASEQVDVGRLKQDGRAGGWQPAPSMGGSWWGRAPIAALQN
jgi:hypothetical protein